MDINATHAEGVGRSGPINSEHVRRTRQPEDSIRRGDDRVEISSVATYLSKLREMPLRQALIERVREEIARGTYDTPEKLDAALDAMMGDQQ